MPRPPRVFISYAYDSEQHKQQVHEFAYQRRADGAAEAAEGRGVQFEAALLRDLLTQDRDAWVHKVLPVVLPSRSTGEIPAFLQPHTASHYVVVSLTIDGIDELYRVITRQPRHHPPALGQLVDF